jgi:hypothetical protein
MKKELAAAATLSLMAFGCHGRKTNQELATEAAAKQSPRVTAQSLRGLDQKINSMEYPPLKGGKENALSISRAQDRNLGVSRSRSR